MEIWTLGQLSRQCHALIVPGYGGCLPRARHRQEHRRRHLARSQNSKWKFLDFLRKFEWSRPDCFDLDRFCWGWGVEEALFWFSIGPRAERYDRGERQPFREREWSEGARIANMWLRAFFAVVVNCHCCQNKTHVNCRELLNLSNQEFQFPDQNETWINECRLEEDMYWSLAVNFANR